MMQTTDLGDLGNGTRLDRHDGPSVMGVLLRRKVRSRAVVVHEVPDQDAAQVMLAEHQDAVKAFSANGTNQAFREGVLPRTLSGRQHFMDPKPLHSVAAAEERESPQQV